MGHEPNHPTEAQEYSPTTSLCPVDIRYLLRTVQSSPGLQRLRSRRDLDPDGRVSRSATPLASLGEVFPVLRRPRISKELSHDMRPDRIVNFPFLHELILFDKALHVTYLLRHLRFLATTTTFLKVDIPPDQFEGLFSTLFPPPPHLFPIDRTTRIALR